MRGAAPAGGDQVAWTMRTASTTPSAVIASATSRSGMCEVTREVHSSPVMLNSQTKPVTPKRCCR